MIGLPTTFPIDVLTATDTRMSDKGNYTCTLAGGGTVTFYVRGTV